MSQLLLDITPDYLPTFDNFVIGRNQELVSALTYALNHPTGERCFYLWGETGSGCTHLLKSCIDAALVKQRPALYTQEDIPEPTAVIAVDNVEALNSERQIELFSLYNQMRDAGAMLITSGRQAPLQLRLRDDLRTRLGWGFVYQVHALTDEEKMEALYQHAQTKGFQLSPELASYLLRHGKRDLTSLLTTLDILDKHSLSLKRTPSIPLLKEILQQDNL